MKSFGTLLIIALLAATLLLAALTPAGQKLLGVKEPVTVAQLQLFFNIVNPGEVDPQLVAKVEPATAMVAVPEAAVEEPITGNTVNETPLPATPREEPRLAPELVVDTPEPAAIAPAEPAEIPLRSVEEISRHPKRWPQTLLLAQSVNFPVIYGGRVVGGAEATPGTRVKLIAVLPASVSVEFNGTAQEIPATSTNLMAHFQSTATLATLGE